MRYKIFLGILLFVCSSVGISQESNQKLFYKHFTGTIDTNMQVSLDLIFENNNVSGYYYYYFPIPGQKETYHFGKNIPLEGEISGDKITMKEYGDKTSKFTGIIDKKWNITGNWKRREYEEPIDFIVSEDYSKNSIELNSYNLKRKQFINTEDKSVDKLPSATVEISLLCPGKKLNKVLKDSIDYIITGFMNYKPEKIKSPELLMENIVFDFFQSYREATDGIEGIQHFASFNWTKKLSMNIRYNENHIISIGFEKYGYTGGAHGINIMKYVVLDMHQNKRLELEDIFGEDYQLQLIKLLDKKLRRINGILPDENLRDAGFLVDQMEISDNFYVNNEGIGFFYNVYQISPYAAGSTELFLPFAELKNILKADIPFNWLTKN
jgi:hypothetical protein